MLAWATVAHPAGLCVPGLPEGVVIKSGWGGLGASSSTRLDMVRQGDAYRMEAAIQNNFPMQKGDLVNGNSTAMVPVARVQALVDALCAPVVPEADPSTFGSPEAIQKAIDKWWKIERWASSPEASADASRYREYLRTARGMTELISEGIRFGRHTDDFPGYVVEARYANGTTLSASSISFNFRMLPWRRGDGKVDGRPDYSQALPDAVAALLPAGATNRERLLEPADAHVLDSVVAAAVWDRASNLDALAAAPQAVDALRKSFVIDRLWLAEKSSYVTMPNNWRRLDKKTTLHAVMHAKNAPSNLSIWASLPLARGALESPADVGAIEKQVQTALGNASIRSRITTAQFSLDYGNVDYHMDVILKQFARQMKMGGRSDEFMRHPGVLDDALLLNEGRMPIYWVLLRDGRAVRWKQALVKPSLPQEWRCDRVPFGDYLPEEGKFPPDNTCYGEIYSHQGTRVK
ncbi:hypothetical protein Lysil_1071 [Lysobacter silvestris]|uniref:Uncharacterized protein n=2 Tax=Solilutibacter silvestris TaxID=1645665 RepID=A0A2K1Q318_9GAMM|nr:hypothetical protein Lysil_1071 [Lysobacter silvestris]